MEPQDQDKIGGRIKLTKSGLQKLLKGAGVIDKHGNLTCKKVDAAAILGIAPNTFNSWYNLRGTYIGVLNRVFTNIVGQDPEEYIDFEYITKTNAVKRKLVESAAEGVPLSDPVFGRFSLGVPPFNPLFTGRQDVLELLYQALKTRNVVALTGMAGIGKTQAAIAYAYRYRHEYNGIYWVNSQSVEAINSGLAGLAGQLNPPIDPVPDQMESAVQAVKNWFTAHSGWLLILDNADDLYVLAQYFPPYINGRLLLTTRAHATARIAKNIEVSKFGPEDSATLLLRRANIIPDTETFEAASVEDREAAIGISHRVDGLPLALELAGAYVEETECSVSDYLRLHNEHGVRFTELVNISLLMNVAQTKAHSENGPAAADLVHLCTFLSPDSIPEEIFTKDRLTLNGFARPLTELDYLQVRANVLAFSLMRRDEKNNSLSIHRQVQEVIRQDMSQDAQRNWAIRAVRMVNDASPEPEFINWPLCERLLPHWQRCAEHINAFVIDTTEASHVLDVAGYYLYQRSHFGEVEKLFMQSLEIKEKIFGTECPEVADGYNNLAALYWSQGYYDKAEPLYKDALAIREKMLPPEHPDVAQALTNLANLYTVQQRYVAVEPLLKRALAIREKEPGQEHLDKTLNGLAVAYHKQGRNKEAEQTYQRALDICEAQRGSEHPDLALPLINFAVFCNDLERYADAKPLLERALTILEKVDSMHPDRAGAIGQLAVVQWKQGQVSQAAEGFQHAIQIFKIVLGEQHPATRRVLHKYTEFQKDVR